MYGSYQKVICFWLYGNRGEIETNTLKIIFFYPLKSFNKVQNPTCCSVSCHLSNSPEIDEKTGNHGSMRSMRSEIILVFLLFNLWTLDWQIYIRIPNTPGVSNMLTYGSQRRISTYNSSLPCKVDFIRMKVKKYFSARISPYPNPGPRSLLTH